MRLRRLVLPVLARLLGSAAAHAQNVTRDVRLIVPYAPGGTVDALARMLAEALSPALGGRSVVVENRSGGGTFIAMQALMNAGPDGHTLSIASTAVLATSAVLPGMVMPIDLDRALQPLSSLIRVPMVLVGQPNAPFRSLAELIVHARANPGRLNIGQSGQGSQTHLLAARFKHEARLAMEEIQYRGGTPALLDILSGNADLYFSLLPESLPFIRDGRLRAIAFASPERNPALPEVPLMRETLPGFTGDVAYDLVVAAGTPPAWLAYWNAAVNRAMNAPEFRARAAALHWVPSNGTPEDYAAESARDRQVWGEVIRAAGIRAGS